MIRIFMIGMSTDKGGVESYITNLCNNFDTEQFEIVYCWPEMEIDGKRWICPRNRHNYIKYYFFWKKFYQNNHFDVVYFNTCDIVSVDALKFAKKAGVSVRVIHSHSTENQREINIFHRITEKWNKKRIKRYATTLLACSKEAGEWMFPNDSFTVIKNGINLHRYCYKTEYRDECRKLLGIRDECLIGCVSRLDSTKNPLRSVEIMSTIAKKDPNAKFVFVGDGEMRSKVENKIDEEKLNGKVILLGARDDANKWYSALDVLLMPSLFEGLPFTLVEAQAAGLPCVVSSAISEKANLTGLIEYVSLNESAEIWAEKILVACKKRRVDTTQRLIELGYSSEETAKKVSIIIEECLKGLKNE